MLFTRLTGEDIPDIDVELINWLGKNKFKNSESATMVLGIENRNKKIYRVIEVSGLKDLVKVMEFLGELDLVDIIDIPYAPKKGYDARLRFLDLMISPEIRHIIGTRND